jgi:hypothetical protein
MGRAFWGKVFERGRKKGSCGARLSLLLVLDV